MDLGAYAQIDDLSGYVARNYGAPPRLRGIRLMAVEEPEEAEGDFALEVYNSFCGQDVVYVHTRCGAYGDDDNEDSNYIFCGGRDWELSTGDLFIKSIDDGWDPTYRDHYFHAVVDDEYLGLVEKMKEAKNDER